MSEWLLWVLASMAYVAIGAILHDRVWRGLKAEYPYVRAAPLWTHAVLTLGWPIIWGVGLLSIVFWSDEDS